MKKRQPAVAGQFYPADPVALRTEIDGYLAAAAETALKPKAMVVPHAGTIYSGPVAASAYVHLRGIREQIQRVLLIGPAHRVFVNGLAASQADVFTTPLGDIPLDQESVEDLLQLDQVHYQDEAHAPEHSLELHLPFLQELLPEFKLVPLVCGAAEASEVAEVIQRAWGGPETLVIISSDLSHYLPYEQAQQVDQITTAQIEALQWEALSSHQACGFYPLRGFLEVAREKELAVKTVDLRNSGDTQGTKEGVVGYGSYLFSEAA